MDLNNDSLRTGNPRALPQLEYNGSFPADTHNYLEVSHKKKKRKKHKSERRKSHKKRLDSSIQTDMNWRIDYVLVYKYVDPKEVWGYSELQQHNEMKANRERFQTAMVEKEKLLLQEEMIGECIYVKVHCPFPRLCEEAEKIRLEMNLKGAAIPPKANKSFFNKMSDIFKTDDEVDFVSAPFITQKRAVFDGIDDPDTFFRPAPRAFLVHHILINMDVREETDKSEIDFVRRKGLPYMLLRKVYCDAFVLHDESPYENMSDDEQDLKRKESNQAGDFDGKQDAREELQRTWCKWTKYQPMWKIRNYFGEQIAFYFAWAGSMASLLWVPMFLGLATWGIGLYYTIYEYKEHRELHDQRYQLYEQLKTNVTLYNRTEDIEAVEDLESQLEQWSLLNFVTEDWLRIFKDSFDTFATPFFALIICLWGTIFLEVWKRKSATLAYEWDVDNYEYSEPDRPQFFGTKNRPDPVSDLPDWYYPFHKQFLKYIASLGILLFMACLVIATVLGVILYRLVMSYLLEGASNSLYRLLAASLVASLANSTMILILGRVYEKIAVKLTDWENHRTQSQYDNSLIIKLFAFSFVNTYSSLFYIAFFRQLTTENGIFNLGSNFHDECSDNNCMSMLSLQVCVLMLVKPCPKFFKDIIVPWSRRLIRKYKCSGRNKIMDNSTEDLSHQAQYIQKEHFKPPVQNFTLSEYNEKIILYGFLMIFSSALPIAPLIALVVILVDLKIDAKRLLWFNRRPVALIASNIGMWFSILQFLSYIGVITNAFIIGFTSSWGRDYFTTNASKLWIVIGFEHIVFGVKFCLAYIIPDVPSDVSLAMRRQKYQVAKILDEAEIQLPFNKCKDEGLPDDYPDLQTNLYEPIISDYPPPDVIYPEGPSTILPPDEVVTDPSPTHKKKQKKQKRRKSKSDSKNNSPKHSGGTEETYVHPDLYPPQVISSSQHYNNNNYAHPPIAYPDGIHSNTALAYPPSQDM